MQKKLIGNPKYVLDADSIIELLKKYPPDVSPFRGIWDKINKAIASGEIISDAQVLGELNEGSDTDRAKVWAKKHPNLFHEEEPSLLAKVQELAHKHPQTVSLRKEKFDADLFLIARGVLLGATVITEESQIRPNKIPDTCRKEGVRAINILDFIRESHADE